MRLLLIEDDEALAQTLKAALLEQHYVVDVAEDGEEGWDYAQAFTYDLILLDVSLPKLDGISLCRRLRQAGYNSPILLLTAKSSSDDKVTGLDAGADDYVVKPCTVQELFARIRALLRRQSDSGAPILAWGKLRLDPSACEVRYDDALIPLSPKEYSLLELFMRHPRRVLRRSAILEHLWSFEDPPGENTIRAHIKGLRRKLKQIGAPDVVETVYGIGYRLKPEPEVSTTKQTQTIAAVDQAWERFKEPIFKRISLIEQTIEALATGNLTEQLRQQSQQQAHKLVGSLGMFGFEEASRLAQELETCWENLAKQDLNETQENSNQERTFDPSRLNRFQSLVTRLRQELGASDTAVNTNATSEIQLPTPVKEYPIQNRKLEEQRGLPQLLVIDSDKFLTKQLQVQGHEWNLNVEVALDLEQGRKAIAQSIPDIVLLDLAFPGDHRAGLKLLRELSTTYPDLSVVVFASHNSFDERLEVARLGGRSFLTKPIEPAQVLEAVQELLQRSRSQQEKVLAVDDDPVLLELIGQYLHPWGVKLTTLEDPRQFWSVLAAKNPDLLILDVEMPHIDGIELCKVVRNDSNWNSLPIIFLTARQDPQTILRIYEAGADDYIPKPVTEPELVTRIFNRLERNYLLRSLAETDQLTGVTNRRQSSKELIKYLRLCQKYCQPLCLAVLDLDYFQSINEQYGYSTGDRILKRLGQILKQRFRSEDVIARWSGTEFLVAMYGMNKQDGSKRLNELLQAFRQEVFPIGDRREPLQVTFSAGVADYPSDGQDLPSLSQAAHRALKLAKNTGRNRVLGVS